MFLNYQRMNFFHMTFKIKIKLHTVQNEFCDFALSVEGWVETLCNDNIRQELQPCANRYDFVQP